MAISVEQLAIMKDEMVNDPLGRGYSGMTYAEKRASLKVKDRSSERDTISSSELLEAVEEADYDGLSAAQITKLQILLGLGSGIIVSAGSKARSWLINMFGSGTSTRTNLLNLINITISRAEELGLPADPTEGEIEKGELS